MKKVLIFYILLLLPYLTYCQGNMWCIVMSRGTGYHSQMWSTRTNFPVEEINKGWAEGKSITSIAYGNGLWALVMSKGTGYNAQTWSTRAYFPDAEIKKGWAEGKSITCLSYGNGVWALVMSSGSSNSAQSWFTRSYFPEEEIKKGWDEGKKITQIAYGNGIWAVVMSSGSGLKSQGIRRRAYFPEEEIRKSWDEDKDITALTYGKGEWVLVVSGGTNFTGQKWVTRLNFPKEEISEGWDTQYGMSLISFGEYDKTKIPGQQIITTRPEEVATASTIHFILFTDTDDSRIGSSCAETNKYFKNTLVPKLKNNTGMLVRTYYFSGIGNYTLSKLNSVISNLPSTSNDAILFYYAGHGYNRGKSNYPTITLGTSGEPLESRQKDLIDIYNTLRSIPHRLLVVMAESCNKIYQTRNDIRTASLVGNFMVGEDLNTHFIELFRDAKGDFLMSSSSKNQLSHLATGQPGFFSCSFRDAFSEVTSNSFTGVSTWDELFNRIIIKTRESVDEIGEIQIPQWCKNNDCN